MRINACPEIHLEIQIQRIDASPEIHQHYWHGNAQTDFPEFPV